jgi:hypothetical protein
VPSATLLAWIEGQLDDDLFIASLTVARTRRGILEKTAGRKRDQPDVGFSGSEGPISAFRWPRAAI